MSPALLLLLWMRFRGWWRRLGRHVATVRGAIFVAFALILSCCWISAVFSDLLVSLFLPEQAQAKAAHVKSQTEDAEAAHVKQVRRFVPLALLGYCLLSVLTSAGDRSLTFSPAEVNLLFAGPFTRRQILGYKITTACVGTLFSALIFTALLRGHAQSSLGAFLAVFLALIFLQFFGIAVALVSETIGESASDVRRKARYVFVGILVLSVLFSVGRDWVGLKPLELVERVEASPVLQFLLTPFRWFGDVFTATDFWPDMVRGVGLCLLLDLLLLAVVFLLDAKYLEAASAASERVYRRLERMRAGPAAALSAGGGKTRFTLPSFPRWGGAGPIAWRQAVTAFRNLKGLIFILLTFASLLLVPLAMQRGDNALNPLVPGVFVGAIWGMSIFLLQMLSFDFRGDLDRMDVLKTLPISSASLVLGQLGTPVAMACILQMASFVFIELVLGGLGWLLGAALLFVLPFNLLLFEVMNLLFLWFPTRLTPTTAGDFQMMGRQAMLFFGIWVIVGILIAIPAILGLLAYWLFNGVAGLAVAWLVLVSIVLGLVPLIGLAFRNFDVAGDVPS